MYSVKRRVTMKSVSNACKRLIKNLDSVARNYLAPFVVYDNFGTYILCWNMKEAKSWLHACGDKAFIAETYDYQIIVKRIQG